jgi:hypothetical protein
MLEHRTLRPRQKAAAVVDMNIYQTRSTVLVKVPLFCVMFVQR